MFSIGRNIYSNKMGLLVIISLVVVIILSLFNLIMYVLPFVPLHTIQDDVKMMLYEFDLLAGKHDIVYWAYGGTLLGAVRERDMIKWDDDGDICMTRSNFDKLLQLDLTASGIHMTTNTPPCVDAKINRIGGTSGAFVDIFIMMETESVDGIHLVQENHIARTTWPNAWFRQEEISDMDRIAAGYVNGHIVMINIPRHSEPYLQRMYGTNWKTPLYTHAHHHCVLRDNVYYPISIATPFIGICLLLITHIIERK
jgi:hypothetical protein